MNGRLVVGADEGKEHRHERRPADEGDVGSGEDFTACQPPVDPDDENAAHHVEEGDADEASGKDEDLPAPDLRIPYDRVDEILQPELGDHLKVGVGKRQATYDKDGDGEPLDALLKGIGHISLFFVCSFGKQR